MSGETKSTSKINETVRKLSKDKNMDTFINTLTAFLDANPKYKFSITRDPRLDKRVAILTEMKDAGWMNNADAFNNLENSNKELVERVKNFLDYELPGSDGQVNESTGEYIMDATVGLIENKFYDFSQVSNSAEAQERERNNEEGAAEEAKEAAGEQAEKGGGRRRSRRAKRGKKSRRSKKIKGGRKSRRGRKSRKSRKTKRR